MTESTTPSALKRGANDGLFFGVYLSAMFLAAVYADVIPILSIVAILLFFCAPIFLFVRMWRDARRYPEQSFFSAVCLHGLVTSICGSLIMCVIAYITLRLARPDYILDNIASTQQLLDTYDAETASQFRKLVKEATSQGALSAISMALGMLWYFSFLGALGSLLCSAVIVLFNRKPTNGTY